jgi:hypothetical protein
MCLDIFVGRNVYELKNERSSSDDSTTTGKEISADDVFEDGRFARGLGTYNNLEGQ